MIDHLGLAVVDLARSRAFFWAALAPLSIRELVEEPASVPGGIAHVGFGVAERAFFWINSGPAGGQTHLAFAAESRAQVDAFHAAALGAGGRDNGAPGLRPRYDPNYYGAFVLDPDGNNIEAVCRRPE